MTVERAKLVGDRPILGKEADQLGRASFAGQISAQIQSLPLEESFVLAINGPWGSGKSSVLSMVAEDLLESEPETICFTFNPWLFSSQEELIGRFFEDLATRLVNGMGKKLKKAGKAINEYLDMLKPAAGLPLIGTQVDGVTKVVGLAATALSAASGAPRGSLSEKREQINDLLLKVGRRIVVMIDDIDRLEPNEVREIFRLVRLVGDFPGIVYLLSFDRTTVEGLLSQEPGAGRRYLEKIVQLPYDLPEPDGAALERVLLSALNAAVGDHSPAPERWPDLYAFCLRPLFTTPREIRRYTAVLPVAIQNLVQEVCLEDLLLLEAVRLLLPEVHQLIAGSADVLSAHDYTDLDTKGRQVKRLKAAYDQLIERAGVHGDTIRHTLRTLFPQTEAVSGNTHHAGWERASWRTRRRVAHYDVLRTYLQRTLPADQLAFDLVERVVHSPGLAKGDVDRLAGSDLEGLFRRLEDYEGKMPVSELVELGVLLMSAFPRLPTERDGFLQPPREIVLTRVLLRMLRPLETPPQVAEIVEALIDRAEPLSACRHLLLTVGHVPDAGHKLVDEQTERRLEARLSERILGVPIPGLAAQGNVLLLVRLVQSSINDGRANSWTQELAGDARAFGPLLRGAVSVGTRGPLGSFHRTKSYRLLWDDLTQAIGTDRLERSVRRLDAHRADLDAETIRALDLALQYLSGERRSGDDPFGDLKHPPPADLAPSGEDQDPAQ